MHLNVSFGAYHSVILQCTSVIIISAGIWIIRHEISIETLQQELPSKLFHIQSLFLVFIVDNSKSITKFFISHLMYKNWTSNQCKMKFFIIIFLKNIHIILQHLGIRGWVLWLIEAFLSNRPFLWEILLNEGLLGHFERSSRLCPGSGIISALHLWSPSSDSLELLTITEIHNFPLSNSSILQYDIDTISAWCKDWLLLLNVDKCCVEFREMAWVPYCFVCLSTLLSQTESRCWQLYSHTTV